MIFRCGRAVRALVVAAALSLGCADDTRPPDQPTQPAEVQALEAKVAQNERDLSRLKREIAAETRRSSRAMEEQGARGAPSRAATDGPAAAGLLSHRDRASFAQLERELGGRSGVAVSALGTKQPVDATGSLRTGVAWSTIKVPLAAASLSAGGSEQQVQAAITASDNAAAEALWASLGGGGSAGVATEQKLAAAGDHRTRVETERLRPGFSAFGQTQWALPAQARFVAGLPCLPEGAQLLTLMGGVVQDQRWGLGSTGYAAQFKGGWGPRPDGGYTVRQMGVLQLDDHPVGVSLITEPADGSFATGARHATAIAKWVARNVATQSAPPRPRCSDR